MLSDSGYEGWFPANRHRISPLLANFHPPSD